MPDLVFEIVGRGWGKVWKRRLLDRYEAAIRLELIRQEVRECARYGFPITQAHCAEVADAERNYDRATAIIAAEAR